MAITRRTSSAKAAGTGAVTPALPGGETAGDLVILVASTIAGGSCSITDNGSVSSWTPMTGSPIDIAGGEKLYVWYGWYTSGSTGPTVTPGSDHCCAATQAYGGVNSVTPINNQNTDSESTSGTSLSFATGVSTTVDNCLVGCVASTGYDSNTAQVPVMSNSSLSSLTLEFNYNTNANGGGGFGFTTGLLATAGSMGTFTCTYAQSSAKAYIAFALQPLVNVTLTVADGTHSHTTDGIVLTQAHTVTVQDGTHAHAADEAGLIQDYLLVMQDALHGHLADNITLETTGDTELTMADGTHAQSAEEPVLTQAHTLTADEAVHGHSTDGIALTQAHTVAVDDSAHGQSTDEIALSQAHTLTLDDAAHAHTVHEITLDISTILSIADTEHALLSDEPEPGLDALEVDLLAPGGGLLRWPKERKYRDMRAAVARAKHAMRSGEPLLVHDLLLAMDVARSSAPAAGNIALIQEFSLKSISPSIIALNTAHPVLGQYMPVETADDDLILMLMGGLKI